MTIEDWERVLKGETARADRAQSENARLRLGLKDIRETINRLLEDGR